MPDCHHATKDQYLASFLLAEGASLAGVTRLGPKRVEVRFVADWRLHELLRLYHSGRAIPLVPSRLFDALKRIKSLARERR